MIRCGIAGGCFTDVTLNSSKSYHHEHALLAATEPRRLHKNMEAACGAVISLCGDIICATVICVRGAAVGYLLMPQEE
jgi:hypothetical protein